MTETYDAVVLGVGGIGSAALEDLARRGLSVCGVELHGIAHDRGSSHGQTRIIRKAYLEHPDYVPLLHRAYALWERLEADSGAALFERTGIIASGHPDSRVAAGQAACYREHDLPHEVWTAKEAAGHYPQLRLPEEWISYFDPEGGFLRVEDCVRQAIAAALRRGAVLYAGEGAARWRPDGDGVVVETDRRRLRAGRLVLTPGPWAVPLLRQVGVEAKILRKVLLWYDGPGAESYAEGRFPCFMIGTDTGSETFYGFPSMAPWGLKVAEHKVSDEDPVANPAAVDRGLRPADEAGVLDFVRGFFPEISPRRSRHVVCMYTMTPDEHFVLDVHPEHPQVVLGAGFSGHGFKFAPVIGEVLGDLAVDGNTRHPIGFLRLDRFAKN